MNLKEQAEQLGIKVDGRWSDKRIQEEIDRARPAKEQIADGMAEHFNDVRAQAMNDLATRIWDGQSISLPKKIRIQRIAKRLMDRGYTAEDLKSLDIG